MIPLYRFTGTFFFAGVTQYEVEVIAADIAEAEEKLKAVFDTDKKGKIGRLEVHHLVEVTHV